MASSGAESIPHASAPSAGIVPVSGPILSTSPSVSSYQPSSSSAGVQSSLPPRIVRRIQLLEFVDMVELLPESWRLEETRDEGCCSHVRRPHSRRALVTDIAVWVECFSMYVAVLAPLFPHHIADFMGYQRTIVRASRNYEGTAWASYDVAFQRQAAATHSLNLGTVDSTLYNEAFTGRARLTTRCKYCLGDSHGSFECIYAPPPSNAPGLPGSQPRPGLPRSGAGGPELCLKFNKPEGNRCYFRRCKFAHLCSKCRQPHPSAECPARGTAVRSRSPHRP